MTFGNFAEGINRETPGNDQDGIEYRCNHNTNNSIDFIVTGEEEDDIKIRTNQGSQQISSGNTFSDGAYLHFRNDGTEKIDWYYYPGNPEEEPIDFFPDGPPYSFFEPIGSDNPNSCPDHYGGGGSDNIILSANDRLQEEAEYNQNLSDFNSVSSLYSSLMDGGNTSGTVIDIETAEPDDMWDLRAQLLGDSPHLSQEVLREMSDRTDVFPDDVLLEILSANPDELLEDTLLQWLEQKEDPLPGYMVDILEQAANGITYKTILQNDMANYHADKVQAGQNIIRSILNDSILNKNDLRNWLTNMECLNTDKQIIQSYLSENDTASALSLLNMLPDLYGLEGDELEDFNDYKSFLLLLINWKYSGKNIYVLDSAEIDTLEYYANYKNGTSMVLARNILSYAYNYNYINCIDINDTSYYKSANSSVYGSLADAFGPKISINPNPVSKWAAFNYEMISEGSIGYIKIINASGKDIQQFRVTGKYGQVVWDTRWEKPGIYFYNFIADGLSKAGKIIVK
jgi:hypothetical protein